MCLKRGEWESQNIFISLNNLLMYHPWYLKHKHKNTLACYLLSHRVGFYCWSTLTREFPDTIEQISWHLRLTSNLKMTELPKYFFIKTVSVSGSVEEAQILVFYWNENVLLYYCFASVCLNFCSKMVIPWHSLQNCYKRPLYLEYTIISQESN